MKNKQEIWQNLVLHSKQITSQPLGNIIKSDANRFNNYSIEYGDLLFDYSKQYINNETKQLLLQLASASNVAEQIKKLFAGEHVNKSEDRPALHMQLRDPSNNADVHQVLQQVEQLISRCLSNNITDIISLGIGGSDLGPLMACKALEFYKKYNFKIHFISNVDGETVTRKLATLNPKNTICIINSKSFTTIETLLNAQHIKQWLGNYAEKNTYAVTANIAKAIDFGITNNNIFAFWDWVGGRYSIWSAVGIPIVLTIGMENFKEFLAGANSIDQHFYNAPFEENIPVIMALLGIWNNNFLHCDTHAVLPYLDSLEYLPAYLQQLDMESNGKHSSIYKTAPVLWGGVGCNGQHAYMQLLHQGTQKVPVDFILGSTGHSNLTAQQHLLVASCFSQSRALLEGNRPSSTIMFPCLTPKVLGSLIALYEHKVFVQGIIWEVNSFDQPGVELGKKITKEILPLLKSNNSNLTELDNATIGLINYYNK